MQRNSLCFRARAPVTGAMSALLMGILLGTANVVPVEAQTVNIATGTALESLGSFTGSLLYTDISATQATFNVSLMNTSPAARGGFITGFAFNNPNGKINNVTLPAGDFKLLGGSSFNGTVDANPLGTFDIGAALGGDWLGGGSPNAGIAVGHTQSFLFTLTGTGLDQLNTLSFVNALSDMKKVADSGPFFAVRFKGFQPDGSDKVTANVTSIIGPQAVVPDGASISLLAGGLLPLLGGAAVRYRRRRHI